MYNRTLIKDLFSEVVEMIPTRDGYGRGLVDAGGGIKDLVVLSADLTESTRSLGFKNKFRDRFIEVGVAEQNMAGVAAGLALEGKIPFCSSYAVFSPGRNWDQVRVSICYNKANVKIAGCHAGLGVGQDGATHQALEDIAITRCLPNLVVLSPCDYLEARKATIAAAKYKGPVYIRLAREKSPVITTEKTSFNIGKGILIKEGKDISIFTTGPMVYQAILAAKELEKEKINAEVINIHTIKPIDKNIIINSVKKTGKAITIEEHQVFGGFGSAVSEVLSQNYPVPLEIIGVQDQFGQSGKPEQLFKKYKITKEEIIKRIKKNY